MLDDFQLTQPVVYKMLRQTVVHNVVSHAYLVDIKHSKNGELFVLAFAKYLLCPQKRSNFECCNGCSQCEKIQNSNFTELKIIRPDGLWIKKEQLDALQEDFSKKALEGERRVYIIHEVDKLNKSAANSLLKFLEEPEGNIVAILTTKNFYQVLNTIVSRCQILTLCYDQKVDDSYEMIDLLQSMTHQKKYDLSLPEDRKKFEEFVEYVIDFILYYEKNGMKTFIYTQKLWHSHFESKDDFLLAFDIMVLYYKDLLNCLCDRKISVFEQSIYEHSKLLMNHSTFSVIQKINIILSQKQKIYFNVNNYLLIDKLLLDFKEVDVI